VKDYLKANPAMFDEITAIVREKLLPKRVIEKTELAEDLDEKAVRKERKKEIIEPVVVDA
jgi:hypothetical protein